MMVSMETYLRRGRRAFQRMALDPRLRETGQFLLYGLSGFLLSAASLLNSPQPIAMGLICAAPGWTSAVMALGAMAGYPAFWGMAGGQGILWAALGAALSLMLGTRQEVRDHPLTIPALAGVFTALSGLAFQVFLKDDTAILVFLLRTAVSFLSAALFTQAFRCRDAVTDWIIGGAMTLALAQVGVGRYLNLGYAAGALMAAAGAFPAAALGGLGLDLARIAPVPMTAVLCLGWFLRTIPFDKKWQHYAAPAGAYLVVMAVWGVWDLLPMISLGLGGALACFLPVQPSMQRRRGETGAAQVRLELGAEVMGAVQQAVLEMEPLPIDEDALLNKAADRACMSCSLRNNCGERKNINLDLLRYPLDADCRKAGRLIPELRRAQEQLRWLKAQQARQREYRTALSQQYRFLGDYLRTLADGLPRREKGLIISFKVQVSARSRGKERSNGDKCMAFPGPGGQYFVLLCDGMGTGLGAAQAANRGANLLRRLLAAGFPPEHALRTLNSLLALGGMAGLVTADLAAVHLDTGLVSLYKWGAAPSWLLHRKGAQKIGTATPPPGISVEETRETVDKLSLRRGEVLILVSDGVDGEDALSRADLTPDMPPGELAAKILEKGCEGGDDATAAVIRLRPTNLVIS